ncbi:MAG: ATPase [Marinilabiliaceae bacterium]|nr:ATPase [Marinilabiliaceae bacterium]
MILIADSGSTTTDWCLMDATQRLYFQTRGINPFMESPVDILQMIQSELLPHLHFPPTNVSFYGAGCVHRGRDNVRDALMQAFPDVPVDVESDLLAAARALCGHQPGIACIVGTGSNSCYYDGLAIVDNVSPLGYVLGDEGSGAVIGRLFVGALLKNQFSDDLKSRFFAEYELTVPDIIERVYRQPYPNRFLASFMPFVHCHLHHEGVGALVMDEFERFIRRNVLQYPQAASLPIHMTGSVAWHFSALMTDVLAQCRLRAGIICASPLEMLVNYHQSRLI